MFVISDNNKDQQKFAEKFVNEISQASSHVVEVIKDNFKDALKLRGYLGRDYKQFLFEHRFYNDGFWFDCIKVPELAKVMSECPLSAHLISAHYFKLTGDELDLTYAYHLAINQIMIELMQLNADNNFNRETFSANTQAQECVKKLDSLKGFRIENLNAIFKMSTNQRDSLVREMKPKLYGTWCWDWHDNDSSDEVLLENLIKFSDELRSYYVDTYFRDFEDFDETLAAADDFQNDFLDTVFAGIISSPYLGLEHHTRPPITQTRS